MYPPNEYQLYVMDISYFSGKMEAYMRYKGIPFIRIEPTWEELVDTVLPATGLMKVPVVRTPEGDWLQDTTPMIEWFEKRFRQRPVLPSCPVQSFFCRLIEDYADEWLWRPALHYRWSYLPDKEMNIRRFQDEFMRNLPMPDWMSHELIARRQLGIYVHGDGVNRQTRDHVEAIYRSNLHWLQNIFSERPYIFGDSPSMADFGYFASMFRHFSRDPSPARIMLEEAPAVYEWTARLWNAGAHGSEHNQPQWVAPEGKLPSGLEGIIQDICEAYLPYLHANAKAFQAGSSTFDVEVQGVSYAKLPVVPYRVWLRQCLQELHSQLTGKAERTVNDTLAPFGGAEVFEHEVLIAPEENFTGPVRRAHEFSLWEKAYFYFTGTHWTAAKQ